MDVLKEHQLICYLLSVLQHLRHNTEAPYCPQVLMLNGKAIIVMYLSFCQ